MNPLQDWFCTYQPISKESMFVGNDYALEIVGVATIKIKMYDGTICIIQEI